MLNKMAKGMAAIIASVAALAATPAYAGMVITYYGPAGGDVWVPYGYEIWCDSGAYYGLIGQTTPYSETSYQSIPC